MHGSGSGRSSHCNDNTCTSTSQLESSWEDVDGSAIPTIKSRTSSGTSSTKNKKNQFRLRIPGIFRQRQGSIFSHKGVSETIDFIPEDPANIATRFPNRRKEPVLYPQQAQSSMKTHPQIQRVRLTASESEANSNGLHNRARYRSSSSLGSAVPKVWSPIGSNKDLTGSRTNRKVLSNRSIGIVSKEDFVMNSSSNKVADYFNSAWNNLKYGWNVKPKVKLSLKSPIWILGRCYTVGNIDSASEKSIVYGAFLSDFRSRIWFTYRRELPIFPGSSLTSDSGWGCMLRSGQMMLAQALLCHFLGRDWRWDPSESTSREKDVFHRQIIRWCGDTSGHDQLFGVHRLVVVGQKCGKRAGDWYGPASLAHILQKAMIMARTANPLLRNLRVYVSQDCTIYKGDVHDLRERRSFSNTDRDAALIILVAVRLGGHRINPLYIPCVKDLMTLRYSIGIIGGRPKHSLYFIGWQDNHFIYLDPHYCQEMVDISSRGFPLDSFHCSEPRRLAVRSMDPSCTLGFYCQNNAEYEDFLQTATEVQEKYCRDYPIFTFLDGKLSDYEQDGLELLSFETDSAGQISDKTNPSPGSWSVIEKHEPRQNSECIDHVVL